MKITITVGNTHEEYDTGTVLLKVAEDFQTDYRYPIVLGKVDGKLTELFRTLNADAEVEFLTTGDKIGNQTIIRSMNMLFVAACSRAGTEDKPVRAILHFSIRSGLYYTVEGCEADDAFVEKVECIMRDMIARKCRITKTSVPTNKAVEKFAAMNMHDKEKLFRTRLHSSVNIYDLDGYEDYNYGYMTYDTSLLGNFTLHR
jgi:uridine kinase